MLLLTLIDILHIIFTAAKWLIIIQAIMSWLIAFNVISIRGDTVGAIWTALDRMTEPLYRPIRKIMPDFGALDLTPMVVLILLIILDGPVLNYLRMVAMGLA